MSRSTTARPSSHLLAAVLMATALATSACAGSAGADAPSSSPATAGCTAPFPCGELPDGFAVEGPAGWTDDGRAGGADGTTTTAAHHWIAPDVATDPLKDRWADIAVYRPTLAFDPLVGTPGAMPADLPEWFRVHPLMRVVAETPVQVDGATGVQFDIEYREGALNTLANAYWSGLVAAADVPGTPREAGVAPAPYERWVLIPFGDGWIVVSASTFRGLKGLTEPTAPDDAVAGVLASMDLP